MIMYGDIAQSLYQNHSISNDPKELFILIYQKVFFSITPKFGHTLLNTRNLCVYNVALFCKVHYSHYISP